MRNILKIICEQEEFVSLYTNEMDTTKFMWGKILSVNENQVMIQSISPNGEPDGIQTKLLDSVIRIEICGQYTEKMKKLLRDSTEYNNSVLHKINENLFEVTLNYALQYNKITSIELLNSGYNDIIGYVTDVNNGVCKINQVDEYGNNDGISYVDIANITRISTDSIDEQRIQRLIQSGDGSPIDKIQ